MRRHQIQISSGFLNDQGVRVALIIFEPELSVVHEAEVHATARFFIERGRHCDAIARHDSPGFVAFTRVRDMREVGRDRQILL